jgi:predicted acylesterase/phospholipase RssA
VKSQINSFWLKTYPVPSSPLVTLPNFKNDSGISEAADRTSLPVPENEEIHSLPSSNDSSPKPKLLNSILHYGRLVGKKAGEIINTSSVVVKDMVNSSKILLSEQRRPASNFTRQNEFSLKLSEPKLSDQDSSKESSFQDVTYTHVSSTYRKSSVLKEWGETIASFLPEIIIIWPWEKQKEQEKEKKRHLQQREIKAEDLPHQDFNELHRIKSDRSEEKETEEEYEEEHNEMEEKSGKKFISLKDNMHLPPEIKYDIVNPEKDYSNVTTSQYLTSGFNRVLSVFGNLFPSTANLTNGQRQGNQQVPCDLSESALVNTTTNKPGNISSTPPPLATPSFFQSLSLRSLFSSSKSSSPPATPENPENKTQPASPTLPVPTLSGLQSLNYYKISLAVYAALHIRNGKDGNEFMKYIGLDPLLEGILCKEQFHDFYTRTDAVKGLGLLMRSQQSLADTIANNTEIISVLCELMEAPLEKPKNKFFSFFKSAVTAHTKQEKETRDSLLRGQHEAISVIHRLIRTSESAVEELRRNSRLRKVLMAIMESESSSLAAASVNERKHENISLSDSSSSSTSGTSTTVLVEPIQLSYEDTKSSKSYLVKNKTQATIVEYVNLKPSQMARVSLWGMGGVPWKPLQPNQKGLRILSFDGGGTRGVLSIAIIKEIFERLSKACGRSVQPTDYFDMICGTSTGGIIALLLGSQRNTIQDAETLYDEFIDKVFGTKSSFKLIRSKAFYDEKEFEKLLYQMCGDQLLLDSNQLRHCPRLFCLSSKVNVNPPQTQIWRNYNYPLGMKSRNPGSYRVNTLTAVRATSAAPTFFTPVPWEGGLFCDGALVANNPTAIAIEEAKVSFSFLLLNFCHFIFFFLFHIRRRCFLKFQLNWLFLLALVSTSTIIRKPCPVWDGICSSVI